MAPRRTRRKRRHVSQDETGLTLIEMIVVLAIIAIVATMITMNVIDRPDQAKATTTKTNILSVEGALKMYRLDNGSYPTTQQGLKALVAKPSSPPVPSSYPSEGYLSRMPADGWDHPFEYESNGSSFTLKSLGKDGKPGGQDLDADIDSKSI
ncbi:type II secretion system major pseudopilin GspG [Stakelama marina]|uniref:type II secretion system major pseudopilin GspG n=1 Tax=Stakelama marina TaxID=2826939 RepID=UPI0024C333A7|nr:type II secretion system major pseudopilin GspG [Stakelama marina]